MGNGKIIAIAAAIILVLFVGITYAILKSGQIDHERATGDLGAELQTQFETLPKMAETALFSKELQTDVPVEYAEARNGYESAKKAYNDAKKNPNDQKATDQMNDAFIEAKENINTMISIQVESVPNVNTDQITELNDVMVNGQRMITSYRKECNKIAAGYNWWREMPPFSIVASVFGFEKIDYFKEEEGAQKIPDLGLVKKN